MPASAAPLRLSSARAKDTPRSRPPGGSKRRAWAPRCAPTPFAAVAGCLALLVTVLVTGPGAVGTAAASPPGTSAHYVTLTGSPGMAEWDAANDTIYVPVQCADELLPDQYKLAKPSTS